MKNTPDRVVGGVLWDLFPFFPDLRAVAHGSLLAVANDGCVEYRRTVRNTLVYGLRRHILQTQVLVLVALGIDQSLKPHRRFHAAVFPQRQLGCMAVIHMDPIAVGDERTNALRMAVAEQVKTIDPRLTIHDFRIVPGPTHTNLIFDTVVPYDVKLPHDQVQKRIGELVRQMDGNYFAVVQIDNSYVL